MLTLFFCFFSSAFGAENVSRVPSKKLRFFNLDLHISVIADVKNIFESMGHEVVNWSISGHTWVLGKLKDSVDIVNENTWTNLDQAMCNEFYERYKDFLEQFDAFIVTHTPSFALLYDKCNKPIIIVNSTRYKSPFADQPQKLQWLNEYLIEGVKRNKIFIVSNNKADREYLKYCTGLESEHIPSLCLYTGSQYTGKNRGFIVHPPQRSDMLNITKEVIEKLHPGYKWQDLYDYQGVIHIPYEISTMSIFEQYSANVPLFFPDKNFLRKLYFDSGSSNSILSNIVYFPIYSLPIPSTVGDPNNIFAAEGISFWVDHADYYDNENMAYIQYFKSFAHLDHLLRTVDLQHISSLMKKHNEKRKKDAFEKWANILQRVQIACSNIPIK